MSFATTSCQKAGAAASTTTSLERMTMFLKMVNGRNGETDVKKLPEAEKRMFEKSDLTEWESIVSTGCWRCSS